MDVNLMRDVRQTFRACAAKCSRIGPRDSAGKKVRAPTMITTPTSSTVNSGPLVGNVPSPAGTVFLPTIEPGDGQHGNDHQEAAGQHVRASVMFHQGVLALSPAKAEPLLPAPLV